LIVSEARNFPDIAAFYHQEVIAPGEKLIRKVLQRGVDSGEFEIADFDYAMFTIVAPMVYLIMMKHSIGACMPVSEQIDPQRYINVMAETMLNGLAKRPAAAKGKK
jgi:hypothetical protein